MKAEDFFPLGWLDRPFRRQPYPDMTYREALDAARVILWNIGTEESQDLEFTLNEITQSMSLEHEVHDGRSVQRVAELSELWRGKVTTLLKWFQTKGGSS
jgi:hypothetical protein